MLQRYIPTGNGSLYIPAERRSAAGRVESAEKKGRKGNFTLPRLCHFVFFFYGYIRFDR